MTVIGCTDTKGSVGWRSKAATYPKAWAHIATPVDLDAAVNPPGGADL